MDMELLKYIILPLFGAFAGFINTMAGGGSFLTTPLLIFTGLDPTIANGTNRLGIFIQSVFGFNKFRTMGYFPVKMAKVSFLPSIAGALLGSYLATVIAEDAFRKYLAFFMVIMTLVTFFKPVSDKKLEDIETAPSTVALLSVLYFLMGIYSGFIQAGVGFLILACCVMSGLDYIRGNSIKMFMNITTAFFSLAVFIYHGKVVWLDGILLGGGMALGAIISVKFSIKAGNVFVKRFVSATVIVFAVLLLITG
ncbi:sulfite exporter TauE/SafE family protein [Seleniivibrio woodruffii]|uniref:sulfite exporter TauE/SafE family protein n=1 Tax=Seleniivibrio woodruffii TaxID=1078050 RepID=UPI00240A13BE|nr:sulfite exporter TauE/SafE family protein [Seleniivibrio woodruffii]